MTKKRHVVIGTSAAGIGAVNKLRELDPAADIIWISDEQEMPYNKCLLAGFLEGSKPLEKVFTRDAAYMQNNNISLMLGRRVTEVVPSQKIVVIDGGQKVLYDNLLIATGTTAQVPNIPGACLKGVLKYQTLADALIIAEYVRLRTIKNMVIVGAGLSGLECADALHMSDNKSVTLIESQKNLLPMLLDEQGSTFLGDQMYKKGIRVLPGSKVTEIIGAHGFVRHVILDDGTTVAADIVIFAVGCKPNSEFVRSTGIKLHNNFIVVDAYQQTSVPSVFAAGDVALVRNQLTGERTVTNRWADAVRQGMIAGSAMAGQLQPYAGLIPWSSSSFFGVRFLAGGQKVGQATVVKFDEHRLETIEVQQGAVVGFYVLSLGAVDVGAYRQILVKKQL